MKTNPGTRPPRGAGPAAALLLLPALVVSVACIHVGPGSGREVLDLYELTPLTRVPAAAAGAGPILAVEEPRAPGALSGDRIAVRPGPNRLSYLAGARWVEPAPRMLGRLLRESLAASGRFAAVGARETAFRADVRLSLELLAFEAELPEAGEGGRVRIRLAALLVAEPRGEVLASRTFHAEVAASERSRTALVAAFDEAFHQVGGEVIEWVAALPMPDADHSKLRP